MWANAQRDGRPAEHSPLPSVQRRKVWLTPVNAAKTAKPVEICRGASNYRMDLSR